MELSGIEALASSLRTRRSPSGATAPRHFPFRQRAANQGRDAELSAVGYLEFSFVWSSSQAKREYAATDRTRSHHGWNTIGKKTISAMSNQYRHPFGIAFCSALGEYCSAGLLTDYTGSVQAARYLLWVWRPTGQPTGRSALPICE